MSAPLVSAPPADPALKTAAPFDAAAAFAEFEKELRASYAYLEREDFDVEAHLQRTREAALRTTSAGQLRRVLHRSAFAFTDPHLLVAPLDDDDPNVWPTSADLAVALRDDRFVVTDVRAGSAADAAGVRPGWTVRKVDGVDIEARVTELFEGLLPAPTALQRSYAAILVANGKRTGDRVIEFEVDGARRTVELANPRELARTVAKMEPLSVEVRERVAIVRFNNALDRQETIAAFDAAIREHAELDAMILDLRNTPSGGNTDVARGIIGHFVREARPYQVHEIPAVVRSTTVPRRFVEYVLPRAPFFEGKVAVLGSRWTGSMGEGLLMGLHAAAGARTFASDLGDLLGAVYSFELPAVGATLELGGESLFHVDGTPRGDYVADVPLASADRDAEGADPAMAAALAWLAAQQ
ncbi:S41 family peptidase [Nannocystis sp. ILAH1]|uniref:S41 family peptidase n=1 Tax=unclassified Nannocystis TaxID=2627009 RepID=UPI00226DE971|nr:MULTISPECIES: S41 family peptidase [unclassified Nannocystis]MCY0989151.1 S41 family peptidase [Nannocystis sp. ILAH1]MCY1067915.1 S41 family peptidase [Nannocystis sp. RBIL2]